MAINLLKSSKARALKFARDSLSSYSTLAYPKFQVAYHHRLIIDALQRVERSEIDRLIITMPPRHGKSLLTSEIFPAWYLGKHPDRSIIATSYGAALAMDFGRKVRNHVADKLHRAVFPLCTPAEDSSAVNRFNLIQGGTYYAIGSGGALTGRGCDLLLIDDPIKSNEDARSEIFRANLKDWYRNVAYTRLQPGGAVILIQTRWHEDDLAGWLLKEHADENWTVLNLPAIAERDEPEGRKEGDALWARFFPVETLERIREAVGGAAWASLYQQRPAAAEGALFKRDWWKRFVSRPDKFEQVVLSLDTAFKTGRTNDYSVGLVLGVAQSAYYVIDCWRDKVEFPELQRKIEILAERHHPNVLLVEEAASGHSLIQTLRANTRLPIKPVKPDSDKITRATAILPLIEAGKVYLPEGCEWVAGFIDECATFPNAAHDDRVDALTQALNYIARAGTTGMYAFMKLEVAAQRVRAGEAAEQVAKDLGLAQGQLDSWLSRPAVVTVPRAKVSPPASPPERAAPTRAGRPWNPWCGILEEK